MVGVVVPVLVTGFQHGLDGVEVRGFLVDLEPPELGDSGGYEAELQREHVADLGWGR